MPVPRDTSVLREIIIVCYVSVKKCKTLSKNGPSQLVKNIIFHPFFFSWISLVSYLFMPVFGTLFSCLSIDNSLYHVIFTHVSVFSVYIGNSKIELFDPQGEF